MKTIGYHRQPSMTTKYLKSRTGLGACHHLSSSSSNKLQYGKIGFERTKPKSTLFRLNRRSTCSDRVEDLEDQQIRQMTGDSTNLTQSSNSHVVPKAKKRPMTGKVPGLRTPLTSSYLVRTEETF